MGQDWNFCLGCENFQFLLTEIAEVLFKIEVCNRLRNYL